MKNKTPLIITLILTFIAELYTFIIFGNMILDKICRNFDVHILDALRNADWFERIFEIDEFSGAIHPYFISFFIAVVAFITIVRYHEEFDLKTKILMAINVFLPSLTLIGFAINYIVGIIFCAALIIIPIIITIFAVRDINDYERTKEQDN